MDVIILGCAENGYGIMRQLRGRKLKVAGLYVHQDESWRHSRYLSEYHRCPDPTREPQNFVDFLLGKKDAWKGALLVPTSDNFVQTLSRHRDTLSESYVVAAESWDKIDTILDKSKLQNLAVSAGVPVPKVLTPADLASGKTPERSLLYPCIIKPHQSHRFYQTFGEKLFVVHNPEELGRRLKECERGHVDVSVMELIPGPPTLLFGHGVYRDTKGNILFEGTRKKLRMSPPENGVARAAVIERNEDASRFVRLLVEKLDYRGLIFFEFKKDLRDGQCKLLDGNPRFVLTHHVQYKAGVNLAYMMYADRILRKDLHPVKPREGVYWINFNQDIRNTFFRSSKQRVGFRDFLEPYINEHTLADFDITDPIPFIRRFAHMLGKLPRLRSARTRSVVEMCLSMGLIDSYAPLLGTLSGLLA